MARVSQEISFKDFTGGLHTESGKYKAPPNTVSDLKNVIINRDGGVSVRKGTDFEAGYTAVSTGVDPAPFSMLSKIPSPLKSPYPPSHISPFAFMS